MFNSSGKKQNTTNRISDKSDKNKDEKNTGCIVAVNNINYNNYKISYYYLQVKSL